MRAAGPCGVVLLLIAASCVEEGHVQESQRRDSYLEAYEDSHGEDAPEIEFEQSPEYHHSPHPSPHYSPARPSYITHPAPSYGPPVSPSYGPPVSPSYGPPVSPSYGPPPPPSYGSPVSPSYGPPVSPSYGPPLPHSYGSPSYGLPSYGPSSGHTYGPTSPSYGLPFSIPSGLLEKFSIHTILTIILKITIFKLIVKFIAILCLLLFIPKFEKITGGGNKGNSTVTENDMEDEMSFRISSGRSSPSLDKLTSVVWSGLDEHVTPNCQGDMYCQIGVVTRYVDTTFSFSRLLEMYGPQAQTAVAKNFNSTTRLRKVNGS